MIITYFFDKNTAILLKFVFLKRNNRKIEYKYQFCSAGSLWNDVLDIYSIKEQVLKDTFLQRPNIQTIIKKKTYKRYHKEYETAQEGEWT